jgi:putative transposase
MAEAFVKTFERDDVYPARESADAVLRALPAWFADYNDHHPHRRLGMRSPRKFRALQRQAA